MASPGGWARRRADRHLAREAPTSTPATTADERTPFLSGPAPPGGRRRGRRWRAGSWIFGVALLGMLVVVATRASEPRELAALAERAAPLWLLAAAVLQSLTYVAQAGVWKIVLHRARMGPSLRQLTVLSLAKLFVDQAIPSAGISGTLLIVKALERRGVARGPIMACVVVETITNFAALGLALLVALAWASLFAGSALLVWGVGGSFIGFCLVAAWAVHRLSRGSSAGLPALALRIPGIREILQALAEAPPGLAHRPRLLVEGTLLNGAIHLLDAATLWTLLRSVGVDASPAGTFASFMLSTLARTVGVVPGGLGTFEAAAVGTLNLAGVPVAAALAAALLFRGVSFWVPLVPGLLLARAELRVQRELRQPRAG